MVEPDGVWSFESDIRRYEQLLAQVQSLKFWTSDKPGWASKEEFQRQVERLQEILTQLREAASKN
ncbi:MAG: hypothetical protein ACRD2G_04205 [Terriglobia bacterium]